MDAKRSPCLRTAPGRWTHRPIVSLLAALGLACLTLTFTTAVRPATSPRHHLNAPTVTFSGVVEDSATNAPIAGARVTIGTGSSTTDASGHYSVTTAAARSFNITIIAPGYLAFTFTLSTKTVVSGAQHVDFTKTLGLKALRTLTDKIWTILPPAPVDPRFGAVEAWRKPTNAQDLNIAWERLTLQWSALQPTGPQDWNAFATGLDKPYDAELQAGRQLVGLLLSTPKWAAMNPAQGSSSPPKGLNLPWNDPDNYWGNFVYRIVKHYTGKIDDWIVWNEVDIPSGSFHTWDGTPAQYAQLVRVAYLAAKAANPHIKIELYGEPYWTDRGAYFRTVLDDLQALPNAAANHDFFDIVALHLYSRPQDMAMVVNWARGELAKRGMSKPVWINETNSVPRDDPLRTYPKANFNSTMDEQASFIIEAMAVDLAVGVQRIEVNRLVDGPDFTHGGEPFGLVRNDNSVRPAYDAYKVATHLFAGVTGGTYVPNSATGIYKVILNRPGMQITVVWDQHPNSGMITIPALGSSAYLVTKLGDTTTVSPQSGQYTIALDGATDNSDPADPKDYVVGGNPIILIQKVK